ncbi:MAG: hypothetical protein ACJ0S4_00815 [Candidatus Rariloculaceae bacterium]
MKQYASQLFAREVLLSLVLLLSPALGSTETYRYGAPLWAAYEGWTENPDGSTNYVFGYMNDNWEEELRVPIGENNSFSPGEADRGQPTFFMPRRNRYTFTVTVPADWGDRELVWTLNGNGSESKAYTNKHRDFFLNNVVMASDSGALGGGRTTPETYINVEPTVTVEGDNEQRSVAVGERRPPGFIGRSGPEFPAEFSVRVGEPLRLRAHLADDGLPSRRTEGGPVVTRKHSRGKDEWQRLIALINNPASVQKTIGLFLSWNLYRGEGEVIFDPPQTKVWEDVRLASNSPWGRLWLPPEIPDDGMIETTATFDTPGAYVLWARVDDGNVPADGYITVTVTE